MKLLKWNGLDTDPSKHIESTTVKPNILPESKLAFEEAKSTSSGERFILPRIEAIHAGTTRNFTRYLADKLKGDPLAKSGVYSWLLPYPKPVIYNHDTNTAATGRVHNAAFSKETKAGRPGIIVIPKITDATAVQGVLDGRLMTVSIGATTDSAVCSFCATDIITEGWCGHQKGEIIDGHTVEWIIGQVWFDELSWVNIPADQDAMVVDSGTVQTAEAFARAGEDFINLGRKSTEWVLTRESAEQNGLVFSELKGELSMATVEELQLKTDQLTATLEQVKTEKTEVEKQFSEATKTIVAKDTIISEMQTQLDAKEVSLVEATSQKEESQTKATELQTTVDSLEAEREGLLTKNTELSSEMHKTTAERVVDLKVILGKVTDRTEAIEQHVTRTADSLKDSLVDLLVEASTFQPRITTVEQVDNPIGLVEDGTEVNLVKSKEKTPITKEDALMGLFMGPGAKRK